MTPRYHALRRTKASVTVAIGTSQWLPVLLTAQLRAKSSSTEEEAR